RRLDEKLAKALKNYSIFRSLRIPVAYDQRYSKKSKNRLRNLLAIHLNQCKIHKSRSGTLPSRNYLVPKMRRLREARRQSLRPGEYHEQNFKGDGSRVRGCINCVCSLGFCTSL